VGNAESAHQRSIVTSILLGVEISYLVTRINASVDLIDHFSTIDGAVTHHCLIALFSSTEGYYLNEPLGAGGGEELNDHVTRFEAHGVFP
jgi:hypothetical protein